MSQEVYAAPWKKIAEGWQKLGIGNHPSPHDVDVYRRFLMDAMRGEDRPNVLLLGATPEIRDMLAEYPEIEVTVLDVNGEAIRAMTSFMKEKPVNEKQAVGDWLFFPLPEYTYDAVFGDQISTNVSFENLDTLYRRIRAALKPSGYLITRITSHFPDTRIYAPEELIEKFSRIPPSKESFTEFWNLLTFFSHRNPVSTTDSTFELLEAHLDVSHMKEYYAMTAEIFSRGKPWNIGRPWADEKRIIERYFSIADKEQDDTFFKDSTFIFCL